MRQLREQNRRLRNARSEVDGEWGSVDYREAEYAKRCKPDASSCLMLSGLTLASRPVRGYACKRRERPDE